MTDINNNQNSHDNIHDIININNDNNNNNQNDDEIDKSKINISEQNMKKKKGKENWQFICHPINKEAGLEIIMKPYKHVVKHTTKLIRGMSATYQCTVHVACQHSYKLVEKAFPDHIQWTLSELNSHSDIPAPKPRGIDPIIRAKVDEFAIMGASPMHILESLSAIGDFKGVELPTRDQISNRIHGRESKKRKLQMEAALNNQRNNNQSSFNYLSRSISSTSPPSSSLLQQQQHQQQQQNHRTQHQFQQQFYQPIIQQQLQQQSTITQSNNELPSNHIDYDLNNIDSYEQAYLDMFGPQLLYHSVYYPEYGLGMVVSSPTDVMIPPLNLSYATNNNNNNNFNNNINNPHHSIIPNMTNSETVTNTSISSISPSSSLTNSTLSSGDDINISNDSQNFHSSSTNSSTTSLPIISTSISVPLAGSSIPITIQPTFPPQWTLLFLHTPPDHNGLYMQCPLGCSGCINGKIHLYVNRTILLAGLMGAVEIANSNSYVPEDVLHCYDDHHHQCQQQPLSQLHQHQQQLPQQQQLSPSKQFYDITSKTSSSPMFFPSFVNYNNNNNDNNNNDNLINNSNNSININTNINNNISDTIQQ